MGHEDLPEVSGGNGRYRRKRILDVNRIIREARPTDMAERKISISAFGISPIMRTCPSRYLRVGSG